MHENKKKSGDNIKLSPEEVYKLVYGYFYWFCG